MMRIVVMCVALVCAVQNAAASGYIVYDSKRGLFGAAMDMPDQRVARSRAVAECQRNGGRCGIHIPVRRGMCGAIAIQRTDLTTGRPVGQRYYRRCAAQRHCKIAAAIVNDRSKRGANVGALRICEAGGRVACKIVYSRCTR